MSEKQIHARPDIADIVTARFITYHERYRRAVTAARAAAGIEGIDIEMLSAEDALPMQKFCTERVLERLRTDGYSGELLLAEDFSERAMLFAERIGALRHGADFAITVAQLLCSRFLEAAVTMLGPFTKKKTEREELLDWCGAVIGVAPPGVAPASIPLEPAGYAAVMRALVPGKVELFKLGIAEFAMLISSPLYVAKQLVWQRHGPCFNCDGDGNAMNARVEEAARPGGELSGEVAYTHGKFAGALTAWIGADVKSVFAA